MKTATSHDSIENLLPYGGEAIYYPNILSQDEASGYFDILLASIAWRHDETVLMGKRIVAKREVAWYGDRAFEYAYSGSSKIALPWTPALKVLKQIAEDTAEARFNSCLLNLYHSGDEGLGWHSDNEDSLVKGATIAAISHGGERRFDLMHRKTKEKVSIMLGNGSLLAMLGATQTHWLHSLPKTAKVTEPRISLTFRLMRESG
ncbi:MAG: alpha-ketoglutarate-dependent dioxygenase AlkB [Pyrinomonadaceae bacterium]